jgi:tetratricopeptide (TPR) repeat protein
VARFHLGAYLEVRPDDARVQFLAARTARRAGEFDEAEQHLLACEALLEQKPDATVGDTKLEWALLQAQRGGLLAVEDYLRSRLRDDNPDLPLILEVLTWELMMSGRLAEARSYLDGWLKRDPDAYTVLARCGWVAEHLFDTTSALEYYRKALSIDPKQDFVRLRVVEILIDKKQAAQAQEDLGILRKHQPKNPSVTVLTARSQQLLGNGAQAAESLDKLLTTEPRNAAALSARGVLALDAKQWTNAERWLRKAAEVDPHNPQTLYNLSLCLNELGKKEEYEQLRKQMAQADNDKKRMDTVIREVMKRPHDPALRYEAGMIFLRNGFNEDAERWLITALHEDPNHRPSHKALADFYQRAGKAEQAAFHRSFLENTVPPPPGGNASR